MVKGGGVRYSTRQCLVRRDWSDIAPDDDWWGGELSDIAPEDDGQEEGCQIKHHTMIDERQELSDIATDDDW